jgi:predicted phosphoadenosine phosphosulfate sulfurtransferase
MTIKEYQDYNVLVAARQRVKNVFDDFEKIYISFSGGKDSTVMMHLVMEEAIKRCRMVGVLIIDLEAQYYDTIKHINNMIDMYKNNIDLHWVAVPMLLRNAVSNFEPRWVCWDEEKEDIWVRDKPRLARNPDEYSFYQPKMEFEEFMVLWGDWYAQGKLTAAFIGIRADESLHRYCAIARNKTGLTFKGYKWTTLVTDQLYNIYPIYDWRTEDIWIFHGKYSNLPHNKIYDKMNMAGVKLSQQRLCQPYGDDQRRGLWLYHILEPETWYKVVARVNGANSGALYVQENGNMTGYNKVTKPDNHTWESFTNLLLKTLPKKTQEHYKKRFKKFIAGWQDRGYDKIPDEAPIELENKCWSPSWRRMAKCILRNDYWCKSLGQTQPKSDAYIQFKEIRAKRKMEKEISKAIVNQSEIF